MIDEAAAEAAEAAAVEVFVAQVQEITNEAAAFLAGEDEVTGDGSEPTGIERQESTGLPAFICTKCGGKKAARASKCQQPCIEGVWCVD